MLTYAVHVLMSLNELGLTMLYVHETVLRSSQCIQYCDTSNEFQIHVDSKLHTLVDPSSQ